MKFTCNADKEAVDMRRHTERVPPHIAHIIPSRKAWHTVLISYSIAVASPIVATCVRLSLDPALNDRLPYAAFIVAVIVTAWYGGFAPSMVAVVLSALSSVYLFVPPRLSSAVSGTPDLIGIAMFIFIAISGALLIRSLQAAQRRAEAGIQEAFDRQRALEHEIAERKRAEGVIKESEARTRSILDHALDAVIGMDCDGLIDDWNPRAEFIFGWTRQEVIGRKLVDTIIPPQYREAHLRGLGHFFKTGEGPVLNRRVEITALARSGREFPIELSVSAVKIDGSYRFNAFVADIAERKRAERNLRDSEERYRSLTLAITSVVWATNPEGEFITPQRSWESYTGQPWEEHKGFGWARALHQDDRERVRQTWIQAMADRTAYESEGRIWCAAAGRYHYFMARGVPLLTPDGTVREWVGTVTDVHDRKKAEEALRQSEAKLVEAQRIGKVGSWEIDLRSNAVQWSEETFRIFGCDPHTFTPTREAVFDLLHPDDHQAVRAAADEAERAGSFHRIHRIVRPDGAERVVVGRGETIRNETGAAVGMIGTVQDVTDQRRAEDSVRQLNAELEQRVSERTAQLEAAYKELEAFSYSVSHDLRAPLRHIDGFAGLLHKRAESALDERGHRYVAMISESARHMGLLIDNLLVFSRMGRADMVRRTVVFEPLVQEVLRDLAPDTEGREIVWKIGALPEVEGDAAMLKQVVSNLLSNAVKYTRMKQKAEIEIGFRANGSGETVIFVRDNGVGFDMQYGHKLFGIFQRLHESDQFEGTGIGLANVRRIIHRHGGRTWAEGEVDHGATFYFSLPSE